MKQREVAFTCTWPDCKETKIFTRKSDFSYAFPTSTRSTSVKLTGRRKHMDKHTRPYICTNLACNSINFGDKAGLLRHQRERHGVANHFCSIPLCTRNRRGFARKRNLDSHIASRHTATSLTAQVDPKSLESDEGMEDAEENQAEFEELRDVGGLRTKLRELERKKEELATCQLKVDEDIRALKRTIELVAIA